MFSRVSRFGEKEDCFKIDGVEIIVVIIIVVIVVKVEMAFFLAKYDVKIDSTEVFFNTCSLIIPK
jgi:hypothetical protein